MASKRVPIIVKVHLDDQITWSKLAIRQSHVVPIYLYFIALAASGQ